MHSTRAQRIGLIIGLLVAFWLALQLFASVLAPFTYTQLLWASALGYAVFGVLPGVHTVIGAGFIAASGLYTAHRERMKAKARRA